MLDRRRYRWQWSCRLRGHGIRISIDDFGVGYSSKSQLLDLPFDELKVDRSFVSATGDAKARAILNATAELRHALGAEVVAEGIETDEAWPWSPQPGPTSPRASSSPTHSRRAS